MCGKLQKNRLITHGVKRRASTHYSIWYPKRDVLCGWAGALNPGEFRVTLAGHSIRSSASLSDNGGKKNTAINTMAESMLYNISDYSQFLKRIDACMAGLVQSTC